MTKCSLCGQSFDPKDGPCGCGFARESGSLVRSHGTPSFPHCLVRQPVATIRVSELREWICALAHCVTHQGQGSINASRVIDELQLAIDGAR